MTGGDFLPLVNKEYIISIGLFHIFMGRCFRCKSYPSIGEIMESQPLLTMTKSRVISSHPQLTSQDESLLGTLSGLCSFHSCEDLASFLFTDMFRNLVGKGEPWIVFEIGVYKDHTKTVEAIPVHDGITFADTSMTGRIPNNIIVVKSESECSTTLSNWHNCAINE